MTIWKFQIPICGMQHIEMPAAAKILTAQAQGSQLCLWAEVDPDAVLKVRRIEIFGTGHPMGNGQRRYIATVQMSNLVWHIYEAL